MCGAVVNGRPHGPQAATTLCQLHMRHFEDGDVIVSGADLLTTGLKITFVGQWANTDVSLAVTGDSLDHGSVTLDLLGTIVVDVTNASWMPKSCEAGSSPPTPKP